MVVVLSALWLAVFAAVATPASAQEETGEPVATAEPTTSEPATQGFGGTLVDAEREPVPGVIIVVTTEDDVEVNSGTSASDGTWFVEVPEPGRYQVTLDVDTLPEGVALRDAERATLTPAVREGRTQPVLFPIGERISSGTSSASHFANLFVDGIRYGMLIALGAVGLSMVYGVTGLVNFAHGELLAFGAIVALWLERGTGFLPAMPLLLAAVIAVVATGAFAGAWEVGIFGPVRRRKSGEIAAMVISIGLALLVRHLYLAIFGSNRDYYIDFRLQSQFSIGPISLTPKAWISMILAGALLLVVGWGLRNTRVGTAMRAVSVNRDLAESSGIDVRRVTVATWIFGGMLAGLSGVLFGVADAVRWTMGMDLLLLLFAAVVLGGLGTAYGAMLGGLVVGVATQVSTFWFPTELKLMVALVVLVLVLLFKPQGILGVRERFG